MTGEDQPRKGMGVFLLTFSVSLQCRGRPSKLVWPGAVARPSRQGPRKSGQSSRAEAAKPQNEKSKKAARVRISAPTLQSLLKKCTPNAVLLLTRGISRLLKARGVQSQLGPPAPEVAFARGRRGEEALPSLPFGLGDERQPGQPVVMQVDRAREGNQSLALTLADETTPTLTCCACSGTNRVLG